MTLEQLRQKIRTERTKLLRIEEQTHTARNAKQQADRALDDALEELRKIRVEAVLADRPADTSALEKKLANFQTAAHNRGLELTALLDARKIQVQVLENAESAIVQQQRELFLAATETKRQRVLDLASELAESAAEVQTIAQQHGYDGRALGDAYLPFDGGNFAQREHLFRVISEAMKLNTVQLTWKKAV